VGKRTATREPIAIGVRGGGSGGAASTQGSINFRANSVFKATARCSKILNYKVYFSVVKNSRAILFCRASASCSKILNYKVYFSVVKNSRAILFCRASASCSKILNVKSIFNTVKNSRETLFSGQAQVTQNSRIIKKYIKYSEFRAPSVFQGKR